MNSKQSVLIIGPFPKPISGVSLANKVVKGILKDSKTFSVDIINTSYPNFEEKIGSFSLKKLFFNLKINLKVGKVFNNNILYIKCLDLFKQFLIIFMCSKQTYFYIFFIFFKNIN